MPSRRSNAPLPALSRLSYSLKIRALYAAVYVRVFARAGTSGSGVWLFKLTRGGTPSSPSSDSVSAAHPASTNVATEGELVIRLGPTTSNTDLVDLLNTAGHTTGTGRAFDINAVQWIRHAHKVPVPKPQNDGELSVKQVAARLGISADAVYTWIANAHLEVRRTPAGRICVPWHDQIEAACIGRIARSVHLKPATTTPNSTAGAAV
jgi:hypothetical protein